MATDPRLVVSCLRVRRKTGRRLDRDDVAMMIRSGASLVAGRTFGLSAVAVLMLLTVTGVVGPLSLHRVPQPIFQPAVQRRFVPVDPTVHAVEGVRVIDGDTF